MSVIIGVPVHNDLESLKEMITSLMISTTFYDQIVIIESGSNQETLDYLKNLEDIQEKIIVINTKMEGPLKAYNKLFQIAQVKDSDLLLTQTDVVFPKLYKRDWLKMMHVQSLNPQVSMVTCINGGGLSGPDYIDGFNWIGGWCTYIPYRTIKQLGGYDENFPNGYGVDIDYSYRASKIGYLAGINYWVDHHMQNERSHDNDPETENKKKEAAAYFRRKHELDR